MTSYDEKRDTKGRIDAILRSVEPQETVLDFGAYSGAVAVGLAEAWGCQVLAVAKEAESTPHPKVKWLQRLLTARDILELGKFDLVLGLSVLHHMRDFGAAFWALNAIARNHVVIEPPHPKEQKPSGDPQRSRCIWELAAGGTVIHESPAYGEWTLNRPLILSAPRIPTGVRGAVMSGKGTVAPALPKFVGLNRVGYVPYPGSLNINLPAATVDRSGPCVESLSRFGMYRFHPCVVNGIRCHAMTNPTGGPLFVEVIAPVRLREALVLADGDFVFIS